jgi:hypothetical protein
MVKKKKSRERSPARRKNAAAKRAPRPRAKTRRSKKTAGKKPPVRKKTGRNTKRALVSRRPQGRAGSSFDAPAEVRGLGPEAGGQSGDTEGLSREELAASESVEELLEEGQAFEAGIISGVENAPDADKGGVRTRQVPEDDVPQEYLDED